MSTHAIKPKFVNGAFVTHQLDSGEVLPHGLRQVGLADQTWWDDHVLIPVRLLMGSPELFLMVLECEDCQ